MALIYIYITFDVCLQKLQPQPNPLLEGAPCGVLSRFRVFGCGQSDWLATAIAHSQFCFLLTLKVTGTRWPAPVLSWFMPPINYRNTIWNIYHKYWSYKPTWLTGVPPCTIKDLRSGVDESFVVPGATMCCSYFLVPSRFIAKSRSTWIFNNGYAA